MQKGVIAAISTPPGKGGVALIRVSGAGAIEISERLFRPISGKRITDYPERTQIYGYVICNGERTDDGMLAYFPAPRSYTGEEMVELSCHGGTLITRTVLEELFALGALPAEPGEFTRRAFLSGKLDLTEAEAIATILDARTSEQLKLGSLPARRALKDRIGEIRSGLVRVLGSVLARVDYPEEDLGELTDEEVISELSAIRDELASLIATYRTGRAINEGIPTVIIGKPNVGKSTLYNALVGRDAAIVTDIAGTTRDLLESEAQLGRVLLRLTDTAGLRAEGDASEVERIGIDRARERAREAELLFALFDLSRPATREDREIISFLRECKGAKICLLNKSDAPGGAFFDCELLPDIFDYTYTCSAKCAGGELIEKLGAAVDSLFTDERISSSSDAVVASARQHGALTRALGFIDTAIAAYGMGIPADAAASDIELAVGAIGETDGRSVSEEVVADIFSRFCVGK